MERDREGERTVRDLRGLEPRAVHPMQDPPQDELLANQDAVVELGRVEVDPARPSEIGANWFLYPAGFDVDADASGADAERSAAEILGPRECPNRIEIAGGELLANE